MTAEIKRCLTYIFRSKGKGVLGERELVYAASMDLHLLPPKEAQKLLEISVREGLLKISDGMLTPTFELSEDVPTEYKPPEGMFKSHTKPERKDPFSEIIGKIMSAAKISKRETVAKINKARERLEVDIEVAALVVARSYWIDVGEDIAIVEQRLLSKAE